MPARVALRIGMFRLRPESLLRRDCAQHDFMRTLRNALGGISNGITGGFKDEHDIDFLIPYRETGPDNDWCWESSGCRSRRGICWR